MKISYGIEVKNGVTEIDCVAHNQWKIVGSSIWKRATGLESDLIGPSFSL